MPEYTITAIDKNTQVKTRTTAVANRVEDIENDLLNKSMIPLSIMRQAEKGRTLSPSGIKVKHISKFLKALAVQLNVGVPMVESLEFIFEHCKNQKLKKVIEHIRDDVADGAPLSSAMEVNSLIFGQVTIGLVRAGEETGNTPENLRIASGLMERRIAIKRQIMGILLMPMITLSVLIGVVIFFLVRIIPVFGKMYNQLGAKLPGATQTLLDVSNLITSNPLKSTALFFMIVTPLIFSRSLFLKTTPLHGLLLKVPVLGGVIKKAIMVIFIKTFVSLSRSGISAQNALLLCRTLSTNFIYQKILGEIVFDIREGSKMTEGFRNNGTEIFDPEFIQMFSVGERVGEMDSVLPEMAKSMDEELNASITTVGELLKYLLIILMAGAVLILLTAMLKPLFDLPKMI